MSEQQTLVDEVESYLRAVASGAVVADTGATDLVAARDLERRLEPFARYVRNQSAPATRKPGDFYVGRPTLWGNSHRLPTKATDDDRRRVVLAYAREFADRSLAQQALMLATLRRILQRGNRLACWCHPALCHAQVLAYWALNGRDPLVPGPGR